MAGHQLPILSLIVPLYMVKIMCSWKQTWEVWPALAAAGGSFALFQFTFATFHVYVPGVVLFPMTAFRIMMRAVTELFAGLRREGTQRSFLDRMQTRQELFYRS